MTTNVLQDIIAHCHQRHEKPLQQRKTTVAPLVYNGLPYHFTVYCASGYAVMLQDLEAAEISFMPIGRASGTDRPPRSFGGDRFLKRQQAKDWKTPRWYKSYGIQVYTGIPSARDDVPWHDIYFKYEAICVVPCGSAITNGFHRIASLLKKRGARKPLWGGSMVSNFT